MDMYKKYCLKCGEWTTIEECPSCGREDTLCEPEYSEKQDMYVIKADMNVVCPACGRLYTVCNATKFECDCGTVVFEIADRYTANQAITANGEPYTPVVMDDESVPYVEVSIASLPVVLSLSNFAK